jgi:hypothetical protein
MTNRTRIIKLDSLPVKSELPSIPPGLAKTHRLIMIEKHKEIQFMMLCAQIRVDDFKKHRAECQSDERKEKRRKNVLVY